MAAVRIGFRPDRSVNQPSRSSGITQPTDNVDRDARSDRSSLTRPHGYQATALGIILGALCIWLYLTSDLLEATIAAAVLLALWFGAVNLRFGWAGMSVALPTLIFVGVMLIYPVQYRVGVEFFSVTAQVIPALFIAFAIESGVVRNRTRVEVRVLAILLAILLSLGELGALLGLAAGAAADGHSNALTWQLTTDIAAITAGFLSIIISMLLRETAETSGPAISEQLDRRPKLEGESRSDTRDGATRESKESSSFRLVGGLLLTVAAAAFWAARRGLRKGHQQAEARSSRSSR